MQNKCKGFSLVELCTVVLIVAVITAIAIPSYHHYVSKKRGRLVTHAVIKTVNMARHMSLKTRRNTSLCGSRSGQICDGSWSAGLLVLMEDTSEIVTYYPFESEIPLTWYGNFGWNDKIIFTSQGASKGQTGSFRYCPEDRENAHDLVLGYSGRIAVRPATRCS